MERERTFPEALAALHEGRAAARPAWGENNRLILEAGYVYPKLKTASLPENRRHTPGAMLTGPQLLIVAGAAPAYPWQPDQADLTATDWIIY